MGKLMLSGVLNNDVLQDNIQEDSIISKRLVKDFLNANALHPHTVEITSQMRASCRHARQRYQQYLEDQKKSVEKDAAASAKEILTLEINDFQKKSPTSRRLSNLWMKSMCL